MLEIIGEQVNPGSVGSFEFGGRRPDHPNHTAILVRTIIIGAISVALTVWAMVEGVAAYKIGYGVGFALTYVLAGWTFRPLPDTSNMGWLGGMMDNPFRWSDDLNRFMLFLKIVLWPGMIVADTLFDFVVFCCGAPDPRQESWEEIRRRRSGQDR